MMQSGWSAVGKWLYCAITGIVLLYAVVGSWHWFVHLGVS